MTDFTGIHNQIAEEYESRAQNEHSINFQLAEMASKEDNIGKRRNILNELNKRRASTLPRLYLSFAKNARSIVKLGTKIFPSTTVEEKNGRFIFGGMPNFTNTFNENTGYIKAITHAATSRETINSKGVTEKRTPCLTLAKSIRPLSQFLRRRRPNEYITNYQLEPILPGEITSCDSSACTNCSDCAKHVEAIKDSLTYMLTPGEQIDGIRHLAMKNFFSAIGSLKSHMDSRGNTASTENKREYDRCAKSHGSLSDVLEVLGSKLIYAYEQDNRNGGAGGIHRDNFGDGQDSRVY